MADLYLTAGKSLVIDFYNFGMLPIILIVIVVLAVMFMVYKHGKNKRRWIRIKGFFHLSLKDIVKLMVQCLLLYILVPYLARLWVYIDSLLPLEISVLLNILIVILLSQSIIISISDKFMGNKYHAVHKAD